MSLSFILYLIDVINNVSDFIGILSVGFVFFALGNYLNWNIQELESSDIERRSRSFIKPSIFFIFLILFSCLLPAKNTMYLMAGSKYLSDKNIPDKVHKAIELKLDDVIKTLSKGK